MIEIINIWIVKKLKDSSIVSFMGPMKKIPYTTRKLKNYKKYRLLGKIQKEHPCYYVLRQRRTDMEEIEKAASFCDKFVYLIFLFKQKTQEKPDFVALRFAKPIAV